MKAAIAVLGCLLGAPLGAQPPVVLVITADSSDFVLAAGGTIAAMVDKGATAHVIRVTNDEKEAWELAPEQAAVRNRSECEQAARILGLKDVISLGYRAWELADVPFTTLRDRLIVYLRHYRPTILFLPNPYTEYDRVLDRFYTGRAAEDAWRAAAFENFVPPFAQVGGLKPHLTPEVYYYAQPLDPRRSEPESTAVFVPQPVIRDIAATLSQKIKAAQALRTIQHSQVMRLKASLAATGRRLPLLDTVNDAAVDRLAEENVRGLARRIGGATPSEEFRYAGVEYRIPSRYLR